MSDKYLSYLQEAKEEDDIKRAIRNTKVEYKNKKKEIKKKINDARIKYAEYSTEIGHTIAKEAISTYEKELLLLQHVYGKKIGFLFAKLKLIRSKKVAAVALTGIILGSYQLYKTYIKAYSNQCRNTQGMDKILCYRRARLNALQKRILYLKKSINQECNKTKDPPKCKIRVASEIEKLTLKVEKYRELI